MNFSHFYEKYNISEFVAFPKGEEVTLSGQKYYKSASLNEKVKKVIMKYADADVRDILVKCVEDEIITPVFLDKDIPQYIINFIREKHRRHQLGSTYNLEKKGYVFINPRLLFVNEKLVYDIIMHELMHLAELKYESKFYSINYKICMEFYKVFFSELLSVKKVSCIDDKDWAALVGRIRKIVKRKSFTFYDIYVPLFIKMEGCTSLSIDDYKILANEFLSFVVEEFKKENFIYEVPSSVWNAARKAYAKITNGGINNTIAQEFWTPTEITSIMAEISPNKKNIKDTIKLFKS